MDENTSTEIPVEVKICPYCGSESIEYFGLDDGGGDYGETVEEYWLCLACVLIFVPHDSFPEG